MNSLMLFLPENPMIWILILGAVFLLFGGSKLPQLAKALGQSKRAFKEGLSESEEEDQTKERKAVEAGNSPLSSIDDETLFEEARRRAKLQASEPKK
jgi:sec-independent protein translocase protein TatA